MGFEIETGIELLVGTPGGRLDSPDLRSHMVLARGNGLVLTVDHWNDDERGVKVPAVEVVADPYAVSGQEYGWASKDALYTAADAVIGMLHRIASRNGSLSTLHGWNNWQVAPEASHLQTGDQNDHGMLLGQLTMGIALSGLPTFLDRMKREWIDRGLHSKRENHLLNASLLFGDEVAGDFLGVPPSLSSAERRSLLDRLSDDPEVQELRGYMALLFLNVGGVTLSLNQWPEDIVAKYLVPLASRTDFHEIRRMLRRPVQNYLSTRSGHVADLYEEAMEIWSTGSGLNWSRYRGRPVILDLPYERADGSAATIRQYLLNGLREVGAAEVRTQRDALDVFTSVPVDSVGGTSKVVIELRGLNIVGRSVRAIRQKADVVQGWGVAADAQARRLDLVYGSRPIGVGTVMRLDVPPRGRSFPSLSQRMQVNSYAAVVVQEALRAAVLAPDTHIVVTANGGTLQDTRFAPFLQTVRSAVNEHRSQHGLPQYPEIEFVYNVGNPASIELSTSRSSRPRSAQQQGAAAGRGAAHGQGYGTGYGGQPSAYGSRAGYGGRSRGLPGGARTDAGAVLDQADLQAGPSGMQEQSGPAEQEAGTSTGSLSARAREKAPMAPRASGAWEGGLDERDELDADEAIDAESAALAEEGLTPALLARAGGVLQSRVGLPLLIGDDEQTRQLREGQRQDLLRVARVLRDRGEDEESARAEANAIAAERGIAAEDVHGLVGGAIGLEIETNAGVQGWNGKRDRPFARDPALELVTDRLHGAPITEIVTEPMKILDDEVRAPADFVLDRLEMALERLGGASTSGDLVDDVLPREQDYEITRDFREHGVRIEGPVFGLALYTQLTVGVTLSGVHDFLRMAKDALAANGGGDGVSVANTESALAFGDEVAADFLDVPAERLPAFARDEGVQTLRGFAALTYSQVAAELTHALVQQSGQRARLRKNYTLVASRVPLQAAREDLPAGPRAFLEDSADRLREMFMARYRSTLGPLVERARNAGHPGDLRTELPDVGHAIADSLDNALLPAPSLVLDPETTLGVRTWFRTLDRGGEGDPLRVPLLPLELRATEIPRHGSGINDLRQLVAKVAAFHRDDYARATKLRELAVREAAGVAEIAPEAVAETPVVEDVASAPARRRLPSTPVAAPVRQAAPRGDFPSADAVGRRDRRGRRGRVGVGGACRPFRGRTWPTSQSTAVRRSPPPTRPPPG
jgi:hypothetical protein